MNLQETEQKRRLDYKWVIMGICFVMVFTALGFCSSNRSLYLKAITKALDIPRSLFSISDSCRFISTAIINLFFGALVLKLGTKKLIACGFLSLIASCLIYSFASQLWMFYVGGCFLGVGLAWCTTTMVGYVVSKWFKKNRGTIMGVILASNGLGTALSSQIVSPMIHDATVAGGFGYRHAYRVTAVILLCVLVLILIFFREKPKDDDSVPAKPGAKKKPSRGAAWIGIPYKDAVRKSYFWVAAACVFMTGASLQSVVSVASAHMEDIGIDPAFIATALSLYSLCLAGTKILTGVSYDHLGLKNTMLICNTSAVVAFFLLASLNSGSRALTICHEVTLAFAMPLETIMLPLIAADMFGEKDYAKIMGLFVSISTAGYAIGSPLTNLVYDMTHTYRVALYCLCGVMAVIAVTFQIVLRKSGKDREAILAAIPAEK